MSIMKLTRLLIRNKFEFGFDYLNDEYCLFLVLGNVEHVIHPKDKKKITEIWRELHKYWINCR